MYILQTMNHFYRFSNNDSGPLFQTDSGQFIGNFMLLFTASIPRGIFCECSEAEVTENPRLVVRNYAEMHNFCASRSVLLFTAP